MMDVLLLSAGVGSRLRPLTNVLPKCLMPIAGKPLLRLWLDLLGESASEIGTVLVNTHYLAPMVEDYLKRVAADQAALASGEPGYSLQTVYEAELLGTGGTIVKNRDRFGDGPVLMAHADNVASFDLRAFMRCHAERPAQAAMTMMTFATDSPKTCGILELDQQGLVQRIHEKVEDPPGNLANAAVYILEAEVIDYMRSLGREVIDFVPEILPEYLGRIYTYHNDVYLRDIGNFGSFLQSQWEFLPHQKFTGEADAIWNDVLDRVGEDFVRAIAEETATHYQSELKDIAQLQSIRSERPRDCVVVGRGDPAVLKAAARNGERNLIALSAN